ncbi:hypothetical protein SNE40_022484 [Patella caerulea]
MKLPSLIDMLKRLLEQYSDGQILKELIQNAEDGGATRIKFMFVNKHHQPSTTLSMWKENPIQFAMKGPALCVYNDGIFTKEDWEGIAAIQCSGKENEPLKVGRFGLGFKSVFHITDTPLILSGNKLMIINPAANVHDVVITKKLRKIDERSRKEILDLMSGIFGFSPEVFQLQDGFSGTIFWFPLRTIESILSKTIYDEKKIRDIFHGFTSLAPSILLFLKKIEIIEIYEKNNRIQKLFEVCLSGGDLLMLRQGRARFIREIECVSGQFASQPITNILRPKIRCKGFNWLQMETSDDEWLVINHYHGGHVSSELKKLVEDDDWPYSPYVSIAACLSQPITRGHVFCFLPLPLEGQSLTGLPVHVNGFFALSQDRHHVKWNTSEQDRNNSHTEKSILWNQHLVKEILPHVYTNLILQLIDDENIRSQPLTSSVRSQRADVVYRTLPNHANVTENWKNLIDPIFQKLYSTACMFTKQKGGIWTKLQNTVFTKLQDENIVHSVEHTYLLCGRNFSRAPNFILDAFRKHGPITFISTKHLRDVLLQHPEVYSQLDSKDKLNLLHYILDNDVNCLQGLTLLPLAGGNFSTFTTGRTATVYIFEDVDDMEMFPGLESLFVKSDIGSDLYHKIYSTTGIFQIKIFDFYDFPNLMKQYPLQGKRVTEPIKRWLCKVWTYIGRHKELIKKTNIDHLYLLPWTDPRTSEVILQRLYEIAISASYTGLESLAEPLSGALEKLNIKVYKSLPEYISTVVVGTFVEYPTPVGLLNCLRRITQDGQKIEGIVHFFNSTATVLEKEHFIRGLNTMKNISDIRNLLRKLHLFPLTPGAKINICLDAVNDIYVYDGRNDIPKKPHPKMIMCSSKMVEAVDVAIKLGARRRTFTEIITNILYHLSTGSVYSMDDTLVFMDYFIRNINIFAYDQQKMALARYIKFIENETGQYCCASDLFDPKSKLLQDMFGYDRSVFPSNRYDKQLNNLKKLGLRSEQEVTDDEILKTAKLINDKYHNSPGSLNLDRIARALLKYLNEYEDNLQTDTVRLISTLTWCPIMDKRPKGYPEKLIFAGGEQPNLLKKPCELIDCKYVNLVGGQQFIATEDMPPSLGVFLIQISDVATSVFNQLLHVSTNYYSRTMAEHQQFMSVLADIYEFLSNYTISRTAVQQKRIVWTGWEGKFQSPENVWLNRKQSDIPLQPYMYSLPDDFDKLLDWFRGMGCESDQSTTVLLKVLRKVRDKHNNYGLQPNDAVNKDLSLVIQIVNTLASSKEDLSEDILLPICSESDDVLQLKQAQECTVCNDDWLSDLVSTQTESDTIYFIHKRISSDTAAIFKVPVLNDRVLKHAEQLDMDFGQTEPLTTRLHNLLKDYTDGFTIPKEIIQNADDAGATTVKLLYDERTVKEAQMCLFNEGMIPCQGPAFWAYNDATFTKDDFINITRLAGATKKDDSMKIGRFGLGFNSVYNLTDVPSFLSGETYVIFDPHRSHLGKSGLKMNLNFPGNQSVRRNMKGQFYPFEGIFGCNILNKDRVHFKGTLFRLPLRNSEEASISEIKGMSYSKSEMKEFIKKIEEGAGNLLLFTQHVHTIELYHLEKGSVAERPKLLMQVLKSSDRSGLSVVETLAEARKAGSNPQLSETIQIALRITTHSNCICGVTESDCTVSFLVNWSFGKGRSLLEASKPHFKGLLPIAATAVSYQCLRNIQGFYKDSHLFCFLPLPIESKLPVHINASFAVQSSRRELAWRNEDDKKSECVEDTWNTVLLEDAGSQAYIHMLTTMAARLSPQEYYRLWPSVFSHPKHDKILTREVYITICKDDFAVFPSINRVVSLNLAAFLCPELRKTEEVGNIAFRALQHFEKDLLDFEEVTVVDLPPSLLENFKRSGCEKQINERIISTLSFYRQIVFPNLNSPYWSKEELDKILVYALLLGKTELNDLISSHNCIPTKPNGRRRRPSDLIHPSGELAKLFAIEEECFPEDIHLYTSDNALNALVSLGMKRNELEWEHLPERITSVLHTELLINRATNVLKYLASTVWYGNNEEVRYKNCPPAICSVISKLEFLATQDPPADWKLPWYGYKNKGRLFISPREGYLPECSNLVGCIQPIVDANEYKYNRKITDVLKWLGVRHLQSGIDLELVIENMLTISKYYIDSGLKDGMFYRVDVAFAEIYKYLHQVIMGDNEEHTMYIKQSLENKPIILHERTLKTADKTVMELRHDLSPYLFKVDPRYKRFKDLFEILGVRAELTSSMLIDVLQSISAEKGNAKLSPDEIDCMNTLCNEFKRIYMYDQQIDLTYRDSLKSIRLPDEEGVLTFTKDLYFDDSEWLLNMLNVKHLHKSFSHHVASLMGVKSKRSHDIESLSSPLFSEFGQHEDLTNRIKRILEGYPCDESILKELLQNADDAGATEVIFIKDFRQLPSKRLPDDKLSQIQGPALCVYNNSCFSERDLQGIQDLGSGSKSDDVLKTGQYGVGFNVVYHITDVPSFWSKGGEIGDVICLFDPHCKYLPSATGKRPGARLEVSGLRGRYTDFMEGYLPKFTNKLDKGTLFRLPLRTKYMAPASRIRSEFTTTKDIEEIMTCIKVQIFPCMLFLENITTIKIASVNQNGDLIIEHEVSSKMNRGDTEKQKEYNSYLCELSHKMGDLQPNTLKAPFEIQITLNLEETKSNKLEQFAIVKRVGFLPKSKFPDKLNTAYNKGIVQKLPRGGVAINLAGEVNGNAYCTLPLPIQTGLPVHINGQFALDHESRRNLWCGQDSVEGQWNEHLAKYVIVPAYISALNYFKDYLLDYRKSWKPNELIRKIEEHFPSIEKATDVFWKTVTKECYQWMALKECQMFPVVTNTSNNLSSITWVKLQIGNDGDFAGCFNMLKYYLKEIGIQPQPTYYRSAGINHQHSVGISEYQLAKIDKLRGILVDLGMKILVSSEIILQQFKMSELDVQSTTPGNVLRFLKSYSENAQRNRCILGNLPCDISLTVFKKSEALKLVLEFVMKGINEDNVNSLYGAPLLLKQDNTVDVFSINSTVIVSKYCDLLPEHSSNFLSSEILNLMDTFMDSFNPFLELNLQSFSNLAKISSTKRICLNNIVPWDSNTPVSENWLLRAWEFISDHLPVDLKRKELILNLNPIVEFSLLPVKRGQETLLYPLSLADHILNDIAFGRISSSNQGTIKVLTELGIPILATFSKFIKRELAVKIDNPSGILELMIKNIDCLHSLSGKQAEHLWKYFSTHVEDIKHIQKIEILPIFQSYDGHMISLDRDKRYICINDSRQTVPKEGLHHWSDVSNIEILRYNHDLHTLYERVKVEITEPCSLYIKYILGNFHCFRLENQLIHLKYIRDHLLYKENCDLNSQLKNVKFVPFEGIMWTASKFYDKENDVFKAMENHLSFPPSPFDQGEWRYFMIVAGLKNEVSSEMFVTFAKIIEHAGVNATSTEQSHTLVRHLICSENTSDAQFCKRIREIKFIEGFHLNSADYRSRIHHQYGCRENFICFNGSFKNVHTNLVWTESNILPPYIIPSSTFLGIQATINPNKFINHLTRICGSLANGNILKEINREPIINLFKELYQYINDNEDVKSMPELRTLNLIFLPDE